MNQCERFQRDTSRLSFVRTNAVFFLVISILSTAYLILGSRLEENKLIKIYGDAYRKYKIEVAGLIPIPWKCITRIRAKELMDESLIQQIKTKGY